MTDNNEIGQSPSLSDLKEIDLNQIIQENQTRAEIDHVESELRMTLEEIARLQKALADAKMKISALQKTGMPNHQNPSFNQELYVSMVNELEQPISTIHEYCDLLLGESVGLLGSLQRKFIERIAYTSENLLSLLNHLSNVATSDHENGHTNLESLAVPELLDPVLNSISEQLRSKQITLGLEIDDDLPVICSDREELEQIIWLLLMNAIQATPDAGSIQISIMKERNNSRRNILLRVHNSGVGIVRDEIDQLFNYRLQESDRKIPGLGVTHKDLVLLKMLVEEQNGQIDVNSDMLQGTTLVVHLPVPET